MEVSYLLPFLIPSLIIQLFIQVYYLKHCWENKRLPRWRKAVYLVAILLANLPAVAVYLLTTGISRPAREDAAEPPPSEEEDRVRQGIFVLLIIAYEIFTLRLVFENVGEAHIYWLVGALALCLTAMIAIVLKPSLAAGRFGFLLPSLQILLLSLVVYLDVGEGSPYLVLAIVAALVNGLPLGQARLYGLAAFVLYCLTQIIRPANLALWGSDDLISTVYVNLLLFVLVFAAFYSLKKEMLSNRRLEGALNTLRTQAAQMEKLAAAAERNRIAGEIHDAVGHTLTSAVIAIEAGEGLLLRDEAAAREKFLLAKQQVRSGLDEIRHSVRATREGEAMDFQAALGALAREIEDSSGFALRIIFGLETALLPIQQHVLLRAVKECATNSIKHGGVREADLLLQESRGQVHFTFSDDGAGGPGTFGFGLGSMAERVRGLGGILTVASAPGEGFTVILSLPIGTEKGGEEG